MRFVKCAWCKSDGPMEGDTGVCQACYEAEQKRFAESIREVEEQVEREYFERQGGGNDKP